LSGVLIVIGGSPLRLDPVPGGIGSPSNVCALGSARILGAVSRLRLSSRSLVLAVIAFALADWGNARAGTSFIPGGVFDEIAHVITMLLVLWALSDRIWARFGAAAVVASVAIDLDHIPQYLGYDFLTRGTPRPYSHSLLTIAIVLGVATIWRRRRDVLFGIALGLVFHFWRDLSEPDSGVALLWPVSDHSFSLSPTIYLVLLGAVAAFDGWKCRMLHVSRRGIIASGAVSQVGGSAPALQGASEPVSRVDAELLVDVTEVELDGLWGHEERLGDLSRREPLGR
jgi:membrane-bound metal-dependent hydrolase YbcI (DUF457 family)